MRVKQRAVGLRIYAATIASLFDRVFLILNYFGYDMCDMFAFLCAGKHAKKMFFFFNILENTRKLLHGWLLLYLAARLTRGRLVRHAHAPIERSVRRRCAQHRVVVGEIVNVPESEVRECGWRGSEVGRGQKDRRRHGK